MDLVQQALKQIGYSEVILDPKGYRRGSLNGMLESAAAGSVSSTR